ncbi:hypothetical protein BH18ACT4_BH18ACT4_12420 [soil metagenome]
MIQSTSHGFSDDFDGVNGRRQLSFARSPVRAALGGAAGSPNLRGVSGRALPTACGLLVAFTLLAAGCTYETRTEATTGRAPAVAANYLSTSELQPTTTTVPFHEYLAADAVVDEVEYFSEPGAPASAGALPNPTHEDWPLAFSVLEQRGDWALVRLPKRPNGSTGWIRSADVTFRPVPNRVIIEVGARRITVLRGNSPEVLFQDAVAVGSPRTPTPLGSFYIDIAVDLRPGHSVYGTWQLSVGGFSEVHYSFGGGNGQIAIHGWNNPSVLGQAVSNGCIRMRNDSINVVADLAPVGTPVEIVA